MDDSNTNYEQEYSVIGSGPMTACRFDFLPRAQSYMYKLSKLITQSKSARLE